LQVSGVKAKLRALLYGLAAIVLELALIYPANLLDQQIDRQVAIHFGSGSDWIGWGARAIVWGSVVVLPFAAYLGGSWLLERWRRQVRLRKILVEVTGPSSVRVIGTREWTKFNAESAIRLAVPDAIAAVDRTRGLLRLKAIGPYQDGAIDLAHVIGIELQRGAARAARGRQAFFRRYNPGFRTLAELPRIRLEIATDGKEPVLEYFLFADLADSGGLEAFCNLLRRATRRAHQSQLVSTETMLDSLPAQGSRYGYGWI
jgi:hypothetical protein